MNYVEGIKIGGATAAQIPSIKGTGAPTTETYGAVGCLYMNTDNGDMYKCISDTDGVYIWETIDGNSTRRYYYTSLSAAVADLNAETTENADATVETAACSLYTGANNEQVLELLADIELTETVTITASNIKFNLNGHQITYTGNYSLKFEGNNSMLDGRVAGSKLYAKDTNSPQIVLMTSGEIVGVHAEVVIDEVACSQSIFTASSGKVFVKDCNVNASFTYSGSSVKYEVYGILSQENANLTIDNTTVNMSASGKIVNGGVYSKKNAGNVSVYNSIVTVNGYNCGSYGPYGIYLSGSAEQCSVCDTEVYANRSDGGGYAFYITDCNNTIVDNIKVIGNFQVGKGTGIKFQNTNACITNSYVNAANEGISAGSGCNAYISQCLILGYFHSLYCVQSKECFAYVNDCTIRCKDNSNIPNCANTNEATACVYVGYGNSTGQVVYIDGCLIESKDKIDAVDWGVVVRSDATLPTTVNLSNCIIDTGLAKPIRIEDGANDNQLAAVNIGYQTVDGAGNPITKDYAADEDVDNISDANADFLRVTNRLYRRLPDNVQATGKDYEAYYAYLMHLADKEE